MDAQPEHTAHRIVIEKFSDGGLGQTDLLLPHKTKAHTVVVPCTIPEEEISITLTHQNKKIFWGQIHTHHQVSPLRQEPTCAHFGTCGSCRWQHMTYEGQLRYKQKYVVELFANTLNGPCSEDIVRFIVPCENPWRYRNKMEFSFNSIGPEKTRTLGMVELGRKQRVFNISMCPIASDWMMQIVLATKKWWDSALLPHFHFGSGSGCLRTLILRQGTHTQDKMVILTIDGGSYDQFALHQESFIASVGPLLQSLCPNSHYSLYLCRHIAMRGHPTRCDYQLLRGSECIEEILFIRSGQAKGHALQFEISPPSFFQPNTLQAEQLYSIALQHAEIRQNSIVYDLYCGTGTFSLFASYYAKEVYGIELSVSAVANATRNAEKNGARNVSFTAGDVGSVLKEWKESGAVPVADVVLVDPPRCGLLTKAIEQIVALAPETIVYLSCNAKTQAQDVAIFVQQGYSIKYLQPIDQFPHTPHVESIVILSRA